MAIGALNKKVPGLLVGAIAVEALDSHAFEVLKHQQTDDRGN